MLPKSYLSPNTEDSITWIACEYQLLWGNLSREDQDIETNMLVLQEYLCFLGQEQSQENFQSPSPVHYPLHSFLVEHAHQKLFRQKKERKDVKVYGKLIQVSSRWNK